jgi:RNA polymerase sigma-70 factor (ECF subfamily)
MRIGDREAERALDAYLAAAARTGDRKALALLFKRWNPAPGDPRLAAARRPRPGRRTRCRKHGWRSVRALPRLADTGAFAAWAYRITSRRCARAIGRAVRDRRTADGARQREDGGRGRRSPNAAPAPGDRSAAADQRAAIAFSISRT